MLPALMTRRFAFPVLAASSAAPCDVDELFNRFVGDSGQNGDSPTRVWNAPVAIWDDEKHVYLELEIPGMGRDDLEIVVHQGNLRICGERKFADESRNYWHNERKYGRFERQIALPDVVDSESIEAELRDGILSVKLQKRPEAQPKKVAIKVG